MDTVIDKLGFQNNNILKNQKHGRNRYFKWDTMGKNNTKH